MTQIKLTKAGKALVTKLRGKGKGIVRPRADVFREYTVKKTGEKILVNESRIFQKRNECLNQAA